MKAKIKNSWIYKNNWIIGIIAIIIVSIVGVTRSNYVEKKGIYTIGVVYNTEGAKSGMKFHFKYYYEGKEYKSSFIEASSSSEYLNKRIYVQFLKDNPKRCIVKEELVPSCIKKVPFDGWETIPTKCDD